MINELEQYTEDELFYKEQYEARKDPEQWKLLLNTWNNRGKELYDQRLIFHEIEGAWNPVNMEDENITRLFSLRDEIAVYKHNRYTPEFEHSHTFFEMIYVLRGSCTNTIQNEKYILQTGDLCLIAPFSSHSIAVFDDSIVLNILVRRASFENLFNSLLRKSNVVSDFFSGSLYLYQQNSYLIARTGDDPILKSIVLNMTAQQLQNKPYRDLMMNSQLFSFLAILLQEHEKSITISSKEKIDPVAVDMIKCIESNYRNITLNELAERFGYSSGYCSRFIRQSTGKSFTQIVQEIKFENICTMLESSDRPISEIASMCGFDSIEHFTRLFKKRMAVSPSQYRKAHS